MIKKVLIFLGILLALGIMAFILFRSYTKSFSPQEEEVIKDDDVEISISYSRPYKDGRKIFGHLVPYGKVWRTGANEATIFSTSKDLVLKGKTLPAGEYSLWTIPEQDKWQVIWNSQTGQWGINLDQEPNKDETKDVLTVTTSVINTSNAFEQFTIDLERVPDDYHMVMMWDSTMVVIPFSVK